jgi:hypothetical protein
MKTVKVMIFNKREGLFFHLVNKWNEIGSCACQSRGLFNALVTGKKKASIVYQILIKKSKKLPAAWVQPEKGILYFFLDKSAGSLLTLNKNFVIN